MRGFDLHHYLAGAVFVDSATVRGRLLSLGRYPGLVDGVDTVQGELYRLSDPPTALEALDDLEEFDPSNPDSSPYLRTSAVVKTSDGSAIAAWVYRYNQPIAGVPVIASGDWRSHLQR